MICLRSANGVGKRTEPFPRELRLFAFWLKSDWRLLYTM